MMYILIKEQLIVQYISRHCFLLSLMMAPPSPRASANIRATSSKSFKDISGERWEPRTSLDPLDLQAMAETKMPS